MKRKRSECIFTKEDIMEAVHGGIVYTREDTLHEILEDEHWKLQEEEITRQVPTVTS